MLMIAEFLRKSAAPPLRGNLNTGLRVRIPSPAPVFLVETEGL
jgi:hypothetical protein